MSKELQVAWDVVRGSEDLNEVGTDPIFPRLVEFTYVRPLVGVMEYIPPHLLA